MASADAAVWIDTDVALGAPRGDVDDGWALAAALSAPSARVLGVSTVFGNTTVVHASSCARALVRYLPSGSAVPEVVVGAAGPGQVTDAARAIAALPSGTRVLALGPLTNVAAALALDPRLSNRIEVSCVGGNPSSWGRFPPLWPFEFNLAKDAAAARRVFADGVPKRVFPLDVSARFRVGPAWLARVAATHHPLARHLVRHSLRWLAYSPLRYGSLRFPLWDVLPVLDALGLLEATMSRRRVRLVGAGRFVADEQVPATTWMTGVNVARARSTLLRLVTASSLA